MKISQLFAFLLFPQLALSQSISFEIDSLKNPYSNDYTIRWRPDLWYNGYDGIKIGARVFSSSPSQKHNFTLSAWYATRLIQQNTPESIKNENQPIQFIASYCTELNAFNPSFLVQSANGLQKYQIAATHKINENLSAELGIQTWNRKDSSFLNYTWFENAYEYDSWNSSIYSELKRTWEKDKLKNELRFYARYGFNGQFDTDYDYSFIEIENLYSTWLTSRKSELRLRFYGRLEVKTHL